MRDHQAIGYWFGIGFPKVIAAGYQIPNI